MRGLADVGFAAPIVVCNAEHRFLVADQLDEVGVKPQALLLEPLARNTGPAIATAALWLLRHDPDALMLVQPSDHVIASLPAFHQAVMQGMAAAQAGRLVTFGIKPDRPDTGYGYIQSGAPLDGNDGVLDVERFVEKPDRDTAQRFVDSGTFYWNSGIFLLGARAYLDELASINAAMLDACRDAVDAAKDGTDCLHLDATALRASTIALDRSCGDGAYRPCCRRSRRDGMERCRFLAGPARHRRRRCGRQRGPGRRAARRCQQLLFAIRGSPAGSRRRRPHHRRRDRRRRAGRGCRFSGRRFARRGTHAPREQVGAAQASDLSSPLGQLPHRRRWRSLPGETHYREAGRQAQPAEALSSRRTLGRRARYGDRPMRRGTQTAS
jgi:hypothetical protein